MNQPTHPLVRKIRPILELRARSRYLDPLQPQWMQGLSAVQRDWLFYSSPAEALRLLALDDRRLRNAALGIGAASGEWVADYELVDERRREQTPKIDTEALIQHSLTPKRSPF